MEKEVEVNIVSAILAAGHIVNTTRWEETTEQGVEIFKQYRERLSKIL